VQPGSRGVNAVIANFVTWKFKPGMREQAFRKIKGGSVESRKAKGFSGLIMLRSMNDPDASYVLAMWDSEGSLDTATEGVIKRIQGSIGEMAAEPPDIKLVNAREIVPLISTPLLRTTLKRLLDHEIRTPRAADPHHIYIVAVANVERHTRPVKGSPVRRSPPSVPKKGLAGRNGTPRPSVSTDWA
jgi:hypothetical protein